MKHIKSMKEHPRLTSKKGIRLKVDNDDDLCEYVAVSSDGRRTLVLCYKQTNKQRLLFLAANSWIKSTCTRKHIKETQVR